MQETGYRQWDAETIELAYQYWAFVCGRNAKATLRALQTDHGLDIPYRTVADWPQRYGWGDRIRQELATIAPDIQSQTVAELILGGLEAARTLRRSVQDDRYILDDDGAIQLDKYGTPIMAPKPDKTQVTAALGLLDRAGFSPLGRTPERTIERPSSLPASVDLAALSIDDVLAMQAEMIDTLMQERERSTATSR